MNAKKIITTLISAVIAFAALAITVRFLSQIPKIENSTDVIFVSIPAKQTAVVNPGAIIAEKGSLQFGDFALFQLMNEETSLEFVSANFGEKPEVLDSARVRVNAGSVLGVNLLFGNALTLLDDRLAATSKGGSFFFEKDAKSDDSEIKISATSVRVLSGIVQLTFLDAENIEIFEGTLLAGEEVKLTDQDIAEIFAAKDALARVAAWQLKIAKFESRFEGESGLISKILAQLPEEKGGWLTAVVNFLKEKFLLSAEVKEDFYAQQLLDSLAETVAGDANAVNKLLATPDAKKRVLLQKVVAKISPLTRVFLTNSLPSPVKEKIMRLADLSGQLTSFAEISQLTSLMQLNRNLIFIINDAGNTKTAQNFLNTAKNGIETTDAETARLLLEILKRDIQTVNSDWLEAWAAVNRGRIVTDLDLATAVTDQLALAKLLVASGREDLAGTTLKELVGLLTQSSAKFSEASLEEIAAEGNELKNRILFLASLRGAVEFDEESYQSWLAKKAKLDAEKATAEEITIIEEEETPAEETPRTPRDDGKVARPRSELEKFMNLLELDDLPTSETQAAENDFAIISKICNAELEEIKKKSYSSSDIEVYETNDYFIVKAVEFMDAEGLIFNAEGNFITTCGGNPAKKRTIENPEICEKYYNPPEQNNLCINLPTSETQTEASFLEEGGFEDCGTSESFINSNLNEILPELDSGLVCFGMNLRECKPAKVLLKTANAGEIEMAVEGGTVDACQISLKYGAADQIPIEEQKVFAEKSILCPVDLEAIKAQSPEKDPVSEPGAFAASVYFYIGMESMNPKTECEEDILNINSNESVKDLSNSNNQNQDNRITFSELFSEKSIDSIKNKFGDQIADSEGCEETTRLEDECVYKFNNLIFKSRKVNYQLYDKNNFDADKSIQKAKEKYNYLIDSYYPAVHKDVTGDLQINNFDEYKKFEFMNKYTIVARKDSWIFEVEYKKTADESFVIEILESMSEKIDN